MAFSFIHPLLTSSSKSHMLVFISWQGKEIKAWPKTWTTEKLREEGWDLNLERYNKHLPVCYLILKSSVKAAPSLCISSVYNMRSCTSFSDSQALSIFYTFGNLLPSIPRELVRNNSYFFSVVSLGYGRLEGSTKSTCPKLVYNLILFKGEFFPFLTVFLTWPSCASQEYLSWFIDPTESLMSVMDLELLKNVIHVHHVPPFMVTAGAWGQASLFFPSLSSMVLVYEWLVAFSPA